MARSQSSGGTKTYVATHNEGKLRELKAIFADSPLTLVKPRKYPDVAEDAGSYIGNAILKAQALATLLQERDLAANVLADDSGLEVDALEGDRESTRRASAERISAGRSGARRCLQTCGAFRPIAARPVSFARWHSSHPGAGQSPPRVPSTVIFSRTSLVLEALATIRSFSTRPRAAALRHWARRRRTTSATGDAPPTRCWPPCIVSEVLRRA